MRNSLKGIHCQLLKELFYEFVNLFLGNVGNKIGMSVLLIVLSAVCIFAPIVDETGKGLPKPIGFYIVGIVLFTLSIVVIIIRYKEIKNKKTRRKSSDL